MTSGDMSLALVGLRVVAIEGGLAIRLIAWLLSDQGADVAWVTRAPGRRLEGADAALARGVTELADGPGALALRDRADVVVAESAPDEAGRALWCVVPGFGSDDPRAGSADDEDVVAAAAALHGLPGMPWPAYGPIPVASVLSALYAATAIVAARATASGARLIEVPRFEAALTAQGLAALLTDRPPPIWRSLQWAASPLLGAWRCADGREIYLHVGLGPHLARLLATLEAQEDLAERVAALRRRLTAPTLADPSSVASPREAARIRSALAAVFATRDAGAWEELLGRAGLSVATVRSGAEWREHPHAVASGQVVTVDDPVSGATSQPGPQVRLGPLGRFGPFGPMGFLAGRELATAEQVLARWGAAPERAEAAPRTAPLAGVRVLDVTQVIAGPMAARALAELGADVVRVENPHLTAAWAPAFHVVYSAGKRSVRLDLKTAEGRRALAGLVERWQPDVVVHNFRVGVAERLGLSREQLAAAVPSVVVVHLDAYGGPGPWAGRSGWEQTAQAATGIQLDAGDGRAELFPIPGTDLGTGLSGALGAVLGLYRRARTGEGTQASACLSSTAALLQVPWLFGDGRAPAEARGTSSKGRGPLRRYYKARDGWMFLAAPAVATLEAVEGLGQLPGDALAGALERRLARETVATWRARVEAAGLASEIGIVKRQGLSVSLRDPRLHEQGLARRRACALGGEVTEIAGPVRIDGRRAALSPASRPGDDTAEVLGALGLSAPAAPPPEVPALGRWARLTWAGHQLRWGAHLAVVKIRDRRG